LVFEPEPMLAQVIEYTHYCPEHWNGRLHSDEVRTPPFKSGANRGLGQKGI
jgi:hypothetical protein